MLPDFAASIESIAPLRVETASGKKVIFRRRAKPVPKAIPVCPPTYTLSEGLADCQRDGKGVGTTSGSGLLSVPIHKLLAEVEELKSQQEAIRSVIPFVLCGRADELGYRIGTMLRPELKNPSERARQRECG
jgi:hypothetical protein